MSCTSSLPKEGSGQGGALQPPSEDPGGCVWPAGHTCSIMVYLPADRDTWGIHSGLEVHAAKDDEHAMMGMPTYACLSAPPASGAGFESRRRSWLDPRHSLTCI
jgi:hypothetical protein